MFPGTSVAEIVALGVDANAIVVGKPLLADDADTGYVDAATFAGWLKQAHAEMKFTAGAMCWSWALDGGAPWAAAVAAALA